MANKMLQSMCVNQRMTQLIQDKFGSDRLVSPLFIVLPANLFAPDCMCVQLFSMQKHVDDATQIGTCRTVTTMMKKGGKPVVDKFVQDGKRTQYHCSGCVLCFKGLWSSRAPMTPVLGTALTNGLQA